MGGIQSINKISFQDMLYCVRNNEVIISVINDTESCLIQGTLSFQHEEQKINTLYTNGEFQKPLIIYGYNACDDNIAIKYKQLVELGFKKVYVYPGGIFEWLLLQDVYTNNNFKTTKIELNMLKYRPKNVFH